MNKDDFNLEDILKKALDVKHEGKKEEHRCDICGGDMDGDEDVDEIKSDIGTMLSFLEKGGLLKLAKEAQEEMDKVLNDCALDFEKYSRTDPSTFRSRMSRKILETAKVVNILNTIILAAGTSSISSLSGEEDPKSVLKMIIKMATL